MSAGDAHVRRPSPPRLLFPLSFPSWWQRAERAPFGVGMVFVFAPGWCFQAKEGRTTWATRALDRLRYWMRPVGEGGVPRVGGGGV